MNRTVTVAVMVIAAGSAITHHAQAQPAAAQVAFDNGRKLMDAGRYDEACLAFEQSQKIDPQIGTRYNLGLCYDKAGRTASAWSAYNEVAQRDTNATRKQKAKQRAAELEPTLTRMRIDAAEPGGGLVVTSNGLDVTASLGIEAPVDPGKYHLAASAPGKEPWSTDVETRGPGQSIAVSVPALAASATGGGGASEGGSSGANAGGGGPSVGGAVTPAGAPKTTISAEGVAMLPLYSCNCYGAFGVNGRVQHRVGAKLAVGGRLGLWYFGDKGPLTTIDVPLLGSARYDLGASRFFAIGELGIAFSHSSSSDRSVTVQKANAVYLGAAAGAGYQRGKLTGRLELDLVNLRSPGAVYLMANVGYDFANL